MAALNTGSEDTYLHSPLPTPSSIRLLRRLDKTSDGLLNFALDVVDLQDQPLYHCLSYTWGNPHANGNLFCEEFESVASEYGVGNLTPIRINGKILKIRQNLYEALCQLPTRGWMSRIMSRPNPETLRTRLHDKAEEGIPALVRCYIIEGANIHARDGLGRVSLHYAALKGHLEAAKVLIKAGSDINAIDQEQKTAKDLALEQGHSDMADLLTDYARAGGKAVLDAVPDFTEHGTDARIWIDAVCIDQANLEERATQVGIMDSVYSNGRYTIAWLGRKDRYTDAALETVGKLVKFGHAFTNSNIVPYRTYSPEDYLKAQLPYISQQDWDALASLFLRQWFRRVWVLQEVIFATSIILYYGDQELQWADLAHVMRLLQARYLDVGHESSRIYIPLNDVATSVEYFLQILYSFREARFELEASPSALSEEQGSELKVAQAQALKDDYSLIKLIMSSFPFRATDHRDKIFALHAVSRLNPETRLQVRPDYKKSIEELYSEVTKAIIESHIDLAVLSMVQDKSLKQIDQLPSWVPDYSLQGTAPLPSSRFMACGTSSLTFGIRFYFSRWCELVLRGVKVDVIDRTANTRLRDSTNKKFQLDTSWFDLVLSMNTNTDYQKAGQSLSEVLWRTLCANTVSRHHETQAPTEYGAMFKAFICAIVCAEPEHQARAEACNRENAIQLGGLMQCALKIDSSDSTSSVGPDEEYMAYMRSELDVQDRSLSSPLFDSVRSTLLKLDTLAATELGANIPTSHEVEAYFKCCVDPIISPGGLVRIPPEIAPFAYAHAAVYGGRRLFATSKGYLGLGPASLNVGDTVWILPGGKVPFVLRPVVVATEEVGSQDLQLFKLVGEAYVHGIMNGEVAPTNEIGMELSEIRVI